MSFVSSLIIGFILLVLIWLGLWDFVETIIDLFIPAENLIVRLVIYFLIFILAALFLLLLIRGLIRDIMVSNVVDSNVDLGDQVSEFLDEVESKISIEERRNL